MRNLRNADCVFTGVEDSLSLTASTWTVGKDQLLCAFGPTQNDALLQLKRWRTNREENPERTEILPSGFTDIIASWDAPCPLPELECDKVLNLHYFADIETACLVFAGGDIVVVRESSILNEDKIEIVGSVDVGVSAVSWSPDGELLALTTNAETLLYMTRDFENIANIQFTPDDLKASKHVSVGWGKSETQFKGKGAKALRDPTMPETVDGGDLSEHDSGNTTISWRGDGAYVAINSIESGKRRVIRVYSREGALDSVSEPVNGLTGALSWRPAGNLIASIQRYADHIEVVFFERNGLRHGQFSLRLSKADMEDWAADVSLNWNIDSSVLAVSFIDRVQLWTMGNYHYYLKQEIFPKSEGRRLTPISVQWHPENPLQLAISASGSIQMFAYEFESSVGPTAPPNDYGIVAVIDGSRLKLTPMRLANIPPPMALHELELRRIAIDVTMTTIEGMTLLGILFEDAVSLYEWNLPTEFKKLPTLRWTVELSRSQSLTNGQSCFNRTINRLISFDHDSQISILQSTDQRARVVDCILVIDRDRGEMQRFVTAKDDQMRISEILPLKKTIWINGKEVAGSSKSTFSLSSAGRLSAKTPNEVVELVRNCTSFLVTPAHLILTTSQSILKFVHLEDMVVPGDTPETDERCRSIERGARLVTVIPSTFALILQMPRGNLETIYPRALVLAGIRNNLDGKRYKRAFLACRNHRVDMNILHDYNPETFIADVDLFVDQVKKVEHIDLFLSQLRNEDVSQTMYIETLPPRMRNVDRSSALSSTSAGLDATQSKVNRICDAFLKALQQREPKGLQNVISAHVCKVPPDLDAGLKEIARLRRNDPEQAESATEHICFLADSNRLYDNALGLYDLELTVLVAQQTQKDPREYLPFLQNFQDMPTLKRQYSIDDHLCRYSKALKNLYDLDAFDEVKEYMVKHSLYSQALELYRYQPQKLSVMMKLHADYLQQNAQYKQAGIVYENLQLYASASESYRLAHLWRECLSCASLVPITLSQLQSLARALCEGLVEGKDFSSAAVIHRDYLNDMPMAARLFCKGYYFADAIRVISIENRADLLDSVVDVGLVEGMAAMTELLADCKSQLNSQVPRIFELRKKKAEDPLAFLEGDLAGGDADIPDNISLAPTDASTMGRSLFTRYTSRTGTVATNATRQTSKRRQREERKRARGKKGSVYEEEYLVNSIGRLVDKVNSVIEEVERLVTGLMRRGMRERALATEAAMVDLIDLCKSAVVKVYGKEIIPGTDEKQLRPDYTDRPSGGDGVLWESIAEQPVRERPLIKKFEKLSLLGG
ncbi:MAG: hypothetical protein Q9191_006525 [Dirinaria sp. TL-2023a]